MKRSCLASLAAVALVTTVGCGSGRGPTGPERSPLQEGRAPSQPLPDRLERAAGQLAALALADQAEAASAALVRMWDAEAGRLAAGGAPSDLLDNALDLLHTLEGRGRYLERTRQLLDEGDPDPVLRRRLQRHLDAQPLRVAERRVREDRTQKIGSIFNRMVAPLARFAMGGSLSAIESGRAAIASLLLLHSFPEATTKERQALRAYQEFLERDPNAPEAAAVRERIARYADQVQRLRHQQAIEAAERALAAGSPDATLAHLDRADRLRSEDPEATELRRRAVTLASERARRIGQSLEARALVGIPLHPESRAELEQLAIAVLDAPLSDIARHATAWEDRHDAGSLRGELRFLQTYWPLAQRDEDEFMNAMREIADLDPDRSSMVRHARWILLDREQNPYAHYRAARRFDRWHRVRWIWLGRHANGPLRRGLPRPLEWILDLPGFAVSLLTTPIRTIQYTNMRHRFGGGVLEAGERYLQHFPQGDHAEEVHVELEDLYGARGQWGQALEHHRGLAEPDPRRIARYRERIAERTLAAAGRRGRIDVRASIYRSVLEEYPDTRAAESARRELRELVTNASPQQIRVSKDFLVKHPSLWEPGALGLRPELLDGEDENGELAEQGIVLLGRTVVRIILEGRPDVTESLPPERFARFIAALEEASYRQLVADTREQAVADPQRDVFFERARLGLLDRSDSRPAARSQAVFMSSSEKYGRLQRRQSILPVEIVLRGGLEDLGIAAFPRVRLPAETRDAFLYR